MESNLTILIRKIYEYLEVKTGKNKKNTEIKEGKNIKNKKDLTFDMQHFTVEDEQRFLL